MSQAPQPPRIGAITFNELTAGLIWPKLLRTLPMALQLPRLVAGVLAAALLGTIIKLFDALRGPIAVPDAEPLHIGRLLAEGTDAAVTSLTSGVITLRPDLAATGLFAGTFGAATEALSRAPISASVLLILLIASWAILGGAIARITAVDVAGDLYMTAREGLGFAFRRWAALANSLLIPCVFMLILALLLRVSGLLLLSLPILNILGALLYGITLLVGLLLVIVAVGFIIAQIIIVPAVATEGADAMDAIQRGYSYILARPGRTLLYAAVLFIQGAIAFAVIAWILHATLAWTQSLTTSWISAERAAALFDDDAAAIAPTIITFWNNAAGLLFAGFMISYYFTGATVLYMLLRRVNDEQDIREIWMPAPDEPAPPHAPPSHAPVPPANTPANTPSPPHDSANADPG